MADRRQPTPVTRQIIGERFLLGDSLPEVVALNIVEDGLPDALRAKPTGIYSSPEVPLEMSEPERTELLASIRSVDENDLTRIVDTFVESLASNRKHT